MAGSNKELSSSILWDSHSIDLPEIQVESCSLPVITCIYFIIPFLNLPTAIRTLIFFCSCQQNQLYCGLNSCSWILPQRQRLTSSLKTSQMQIPTFVVYIFKTIVCLISLNTALCPLIWHSGTTRNIFLFILLLQVNNRV